MRAVALLSAAVLLLACAAFGGADAATFSARDARYTDLHARHGRRHAQRAPVKLTPQQVAAYVNGGGHSSSSSSSSSKSNGYGQVYQLVWELGLALATRNTTVASNILADDAILVNNQMLCGIQSKEDFISDIVNQPTSAVTFQLGGWVGNYDSQGMFNVQSAAVMSAGSPVANTTQVVNDQVWYAMLNDDGTKLAVFEIITDSAWKQANATSMLSVWQRLKGAVELRDANAFGSLLAPDASWYLTYAWDEFKPLMLNNKSAIVSQLSTQWAKEVRSAVIPSFAFVACDFVVTSVVASVIRADGTAFVNKFFFNFRLNSDYKVASITEHAQQIFFM